MILSEETTSENKGKDTATALGFYSGLNSIFSLIAVSSAGFLRYTFDPKTMFIFSSAGTMILIIYFLLSFRIKDHSFR